MKKKGGEMRAQFQSNPAFSNLIDVMGVALKWFLNFIIVISGSGLFLFDKYELKERLMLLQKVFHFYHFELYCTG